MRSGAMHRAYGSRCGMMLRHRYEEVGLPWRKTIGSPEPVSAYEIQVLTSSSFLRGRGSAAEICVSLSLMLPSPLDELTRLIRLRGIARKHRHVCPRGRGGRKIAAVSKLRAARGQIRWPRIASESFGDGATRTRGRLPNNKNTWPSGWPSDSTSGRS